MTHITSDVHQAQNAYILLSGDKWLLGDVFVTQDPFAFVFTAGCVLNSEYLLHSGQWYNVSQDIFFLELPILYHIVFICEILLTIKPS